MPETNPIVDIRATVVETRRISTAVSIITLDCPAIAATARAGNFINVKVSDLTLPLLRRPFSIHNVRGTLIDIMVKSIGSGTTLFCDRPAGSTVMVLGPLGNCFDIAGREFDIAILLSGGIGTAPMLFLEKTLAANGKKVINLIGGQSKEDLLAGELSNCRFATDDGSAGFRGNVVQLLQSELVALEKEGTAKGGESVLNAWGLPASLVGSRRESRKMVLSSRAKVLSFHLTVLPSKEMGWVWSRAV